MIKTSKECRKKLQSENRYLEVADKIILADGTELQLNNGKILSYSISDATSSTNSFDIGAAIIGKWTATLNNQDGQYDSMTLEGASVAAIVSIDLEEEPELLRKARIRYTMQHAREQACAWKLMIIWLASIKSMTVSLPIRRQSARLCRMPAGAAASYLHPRDGITMTML